MKLTKIIIIITSTVMLALTIWFRFIRERLPKVVPFELTEIGFIFLLCVCLIYTYMILNIILCFKKSNKDINKYLYILLFKSPTLLTDFLLTNNKNISYYLTGLILKLDTLNITVIYLTCEIIPRLILVMAFSIEVIIINQIKIFYLLIVLGSLSLCIKLIVHILNDILLNNIKVIDDRVDIGCYDNNSQQITFITTEILIKLQTQRVINKQPIIDYSFITKQAYLNTLRQEFNIPPTQRVSKFLNLSDLKQKIKIVINTSTLISKFIYMYELQGNFFKYINLFIYTLYLITWAYILLRSFHTISFKPYVIYYGIDNIEPFSQLPLIF